MLVLAENQVTNKMMLEEDIIGIVKGTSVDIVKNDFTEHTGMVTFATYINIVRRNVGEDVSYSQLFEPLEGRGGSGESNPEADMARQVEGFVMGLGKLFKDIAEDVKAEAENMNKDVNEDVDRFKENIRPNVEKLANAFGNLIKRAEAEAQIARLEAVKQFAIAEGISTKKFIKKTDDKIAVLKEAIK